MNIKELYEAKAAKAKEAKALIDASDKENRDLTDDEQATFDALDKEITSLQARIDRKEKMDAINMQNAREVPNANVQAAQEASGQVGEVKDMREEDPNRGFKSFGEFALATKNAALNVEFDERLNIGALTNYSQGSVDADGGYAIPPGFEEEIARHTFNQQNFLSYTRAVPVRGSSMSFPKSESTPWGADGIRAFWTAEGDPITDSKVALGKETLSLEKVAALVPVTDELQEDAIALGAYLSDQMPSAITYEVNEALIDGDGSGKPTGFLQSGAKLAVAAEGGQAAGSIVLENIAKMYSAMPAASLQNAIWIANSNVLVHLMTMTVGNTAVFLPAGSIAGSPFGTLLGRPIIFSESAKAVGTEGDLSFVDWTKYKAINKGNNLKLASSMHLYFDRDMTAFRATFRVDGKPWASSPITMPDTTQKSAFVTLATRA